MEGSQVRLWQAVLLLVPHAAAEGVLAATATAAALFARLGAHDHPLPVRLLLEWALVRLLVAAPAALYTVLLPYAVSPSPPLARLHAQLKRACMGQGVY
jgi:hypothetical protein